MIGYIVAKLFAASMAITLSCSCFVAQLAFFVCFGEGWIGRSFSRSNGNAIAETNWRSQ
jgi:hypothetical protein